MRDWTELLPEGVESPVVVEVRHPGAWSADKTANVAVIRQLQAVMDDPAWKASRDKMLANIGADRFIMMTVKKEHGQGSPNQVHVEVHLPATVAAPDVQRTTKEVVEWLKSSEMGAVLLKVGRGHRMAAETVKGVRYKKVKDLGHIQELEDVGAKIRSRTEKT